MGFAEQRQRRLHRLIDLALVYRRCTKTEMAGILKRDHSRLYPDTDNPTLDLLLGLADALEWPIDAVVQYLDTGSAPVGEQFSESEFDTLDKAAREAHRAGQFKRMVEIARRMFAVAKTAEERARASNREHGGWDGLGRYTQALEATTRGVAQAPISNDRRLQLQANLANTHWSLGDYTAAHAHSHVILDYYRRQPPAGVVECKTAAFALFVRGNTHRSMMLLETDNAGDLARLAKRDLEMAQQKHDEMAIEFDDQRLAAIAHTCRAFLVEVDVQLGLKTPQDAVNELQAGAELPADTQASVVADWRESCGWWCITGASIALRHLKGRPLQQMVNYFTARALEAAKQLDNWSLREQAFSLRYDLQRNLSELTGLEFNFAIDQDDLRLITGTMGRFPRFRSIGWKILETAKVLQFSERKSRHA